MAAVLGVLRDPQETLAAVELVRRAGFDQVEIYSPVPSHELEEAVHPGPSKVRAYTLVGGLTGAVLGYLMPIWMAYDWELVIGGKPFASIPAYTVIAFELAILIGGVLTVIGLLIHGLALGREKVSAYRPSFSDDDFGCLVTCQEDQLRRVQELLESAGCTEVNVVEG
jgi:hypothetical protein